MKKKVLVVPLGVPPELLIWKRTLILIIKAVAFVLAPIARLIGWLFQLCFGWLSNRYAKRLTEEFALEIQTHLEFLFKERGARILPAPATIPHHLRHSTIVNIAADTLLFQFLQFRGDFEVKVSPLTKPDDSESLSLMLETILCPPESRQLIHNKCHLLRTLPQVLYPHFDVLKHALSSENYSSTLEKAVAAHNARIESQFAELQAKGLHPEIL